MDFGKVFKAAKSVWDNGGKELAEMIIANSSEPKDKKQGIASQSGTPASATPANAPSTTNKEAEVVEAEVVEAEVVEEKPARETTDTGIMKVSENMSKEDDEAFVESLQNGFSNVSANNPKEAMQALKLFVDATNETIKFVKQQEVKREKILADRDTQIAKIEATKEVLKEYLEKTFDERKDTFSKYFEIVDAALEKGDNAVLTKALDSINTLAASSPFKDLSNMNTFKEIMNNNDEDLDI